jgi:hypothetical protein
MLPLERFGAVDPSTCTWRVVFKGTEGDLLDAAQDPAVGDDFTLGSTAGTISGSEVRLQVRASGIPPSGSVVNNREYWRVQLVDSSGNRKAIQPVGSAWYSFHSGFVMLTFPAGELVLAPV